MRKQAAVASTEDLSTHLLPTDRTRRNITIGHQVVFRTKQLKCVIFNYNCFRQILLLLWNILHVSVILREGADKSLAQPGRKKLQRPNSGFIRRTPHETQYTS